jgi:hypothetical protein
MKTRHPGVTLMMGLLALVVALPVTPWPGAILNPAGRPGAADEPGAR